MTDEDKEWAELAAKMDNLTDHEYIRKHILEYAGVPDEVRSIDHKKESAIIQQQTEEVFRLCRNRLLMGRYRYGPVSTLNHFDSTETMASKLEAYKDTRNTEALIDLINYAYLEYRFGTHPDKHFSAIDDGKHMPEKHRW